MADKKVRYGEADPFRKYEEAAGIITPESKPIVPDTKAVTPPVVSPSVPVPKAKVERPGKLYPLSDIMEKRSGNALREAVMGSSGAVTRAARGKKKKVGVME